MCSRTPISRFGLLEWINDCLLLNMTKIQQLGSGSVYCQLLDAAFPERVPLHKVKWNAKLETEFLHNFKILQTSFEYLGIEKKIDITKLSKARYQDNLEFLQWLKSFLEDKIDYQAYEPLKRRNHARVCFDFAEKKKFNVTLKASDKENVNDSTSKMRMSCKSNSSMTSLRSSQLNSSRSTVQFQKRKSINAIQVVSKQMPGKRASLGPCQSQKMLYGNCKVELPRPNNLKNVVVIESDEEDEIF